MIVSDHNALRYVKDCVFAFVHGKNVISVDYSRVRPRMDSLYGKTYLVDGSRIDTAINLKTLERASFMLAVRLKLDHSKLPSIPSSLDECKHSEWLSTRPQTSCVSLLKQGTTNLNGLIDVHLECARCRDGVFQRLVVKQYFKNVGKICLSRKTCLLDSSDFSSMQTLVVNVDVSIGVMTVYVDHDKRATIPLDPSCLKVDKFNQPRLSNIECSCATIGDKNEALSLESAVLVNRSVGPIGIDAILKEVV